MVELSCKTALLLIYFSYKERGALVDQFCDDLEAKFNGMKRAEEIQAKLAPQFPSFIKSMYPSHVTSKFDMVSLRFVQFLKLFKLVTFTFL